MQSGPHPLVVRLEEGDGRVVVMAVAGDLDLASAPVLRERLVKLVEELEVVVDVSGVEFCDSAGLRVLVEAHEIALAHGTGLRLAAPSPAVEHVLELAGAKASLEVHRTREDALGG